MYTDAHGQSDSQSSTQIASELLLPFDRLEQ